MSLENPKKKKVLDDERAIKILQAIEEEEGKINSRWKVRDVEVKETRDSTGRISEVQVFDKDGKLIYLKDEKGIRDYTGRTKGIN